MSMIKSALAEGGTSDNDSSVITSRQAIEFEIDTYEAWKSVDEEFLSEALSEKEKALYLQSFVDCEYTLEQLKEKLAMTIAAEKAEGGAPALNAHGANN